MWELFSQKIKPEKLRPGDHIYTWRLGLIYSHHGIYIGKDNKVIHFVNQKEESAIIGVVTGSTNISSSGSICRQEPQCSRNGGNGVLLTCLDCFLNGGDLYRYVYGKNIVFLLLKLPGTCTSASSDPENEVVNRANYLHQNGYGEYNLLENNCEDFALYCKTGLMSTNPTKQGRSGQVNFNTFCGEGRGVVNDLGYRKDVTKVNVEELAAFLEQHKDVLKIPINKKLWYIERMSRRLRWWSCLHS